MMIENNTLRASDLMVRREGRSFLSPKLLFGGSAIIHSNPHISRRMKAILLPPLPLPMHRADSRVKYCGRKAGAESNMISLARSLACYIARGGLPSRKVVLCRTSVRPSLPSSTGRIFSLTQLCNQQTTLRRESEAEKGGLLLVERVG